MKRLALVGVLASLIACATAPPAASPIGQAAFKKTQLVHALGAIQDVAIAGNETVPLPLISTDTTRAVVEWVQSALLVIQASANGWPATLAVSLEELSRRIPDKDKALLGPYISLAANLIKGLT